MTTFLFLSIHTFFANSIELESSTDLLDWIQSDNALLPQPMAAMAVGYDSTADSIFLIGSPDITTHLIVEYDIATNLYISHGSFSNQVSLNGQSYVTIKDTMYIYTSDVSHSYISTFNMTSKQYDSNAIPKPNVQMWSPCLTQKDDRYLIVLGGYQETQIYYTTFRIFDIIQKQWLTDGPEMIQKRMAFTCGIARDSVRKNDYLYAIAGWDGITHLSNVERINIDNILDINAESWTMLTDSLSDGRYGLRSAIIDDTIYAIAGWKGTEYTYVATVDRIDVTTNTISTDNSLVTSVGYPGVVVAYKQHTIFVFGGHLTPGGANTDTLQYSEYIPSTTTSTTTAALTTAVSVIEPDPQYVTVSEISEISTETRSNEIPMEDSEDLTVLETILVAFSGTLLMIVLCAFAILFHYNTKRSFNSDEYRTSLSHIDCPSDVKSTTVPIKFGAETDLTINMVSPLVPILEDIQSDVTWKYKQMWKWNNSEVFDWAKSVNLGNQLNHKVLAEIRSAQCTGKDIRSLATPEHVRDSFGIVNNNALCANILFKIVSFKPEAKAKDVVQKRFKINIFSQQNHLVLNEEVTKNETVQYIKVLYKIQSGVATNIDDIYFYYKNQLLESEKTLEQVNIVNDQHLITVKFGTDGIN